MLLLGAAFFPPVSYIALIAKEFSFGERGYSPAQVYIEACESYQKQSWRNRLRFLAADGPQDFSFPVVHEKGIPISQTRVDYSSGWLRLLERALCSAYHSSAYFDWYKDELFALLESEPQGLLELDTAVLRFLLEKLGIRAEIRYTREYIPENKQVASTPYGLDYRWTLHPKRPNRILQELALLRPYYQVFASKFGFTADLSAADLLFNEGPEALLYLKKLPTCAPPEGLRGALEPQP